MAQAYYEPHKGYPQQPPPAHGFSSQQNGLYQPQGGPNTSYQSQGGPQMQTPAPYAQPSSAWPQDKPGNGTYGNASDDQPRFTRPSRMPRDPLFLLFFVANTLGFAALSGIVINQYIKYGGNGGGLSGAAGALTLNRQTIYLLLVITGTSFVVASLYLALVRTFTKVIMEITLVLSVVLNIGIAVYYYIEKASSAYWSGAIIFTVIAIISVLSYWFMRKRIPFAKLLLQVVIDVSKHHPSVYAVVIIGLIVQTAVSIWYAYVTVAIYVTYSPNSPACATNSCSSGKVTGLIVYSTFSYIWLSQVIANVTLATLAGGVYGGWYYLGPRAKKGTSGAGVNGDGQSTGIPSKANLKSFVRAATTSLGSIAFGSLIVTLLELLRMLLQAFTNEQMQQGDTIGAIIGCCATCCVGFIDWMVQFFNRYAYIEIALYGKAYLSAAKDAWNLLKKRGVDALVNDSLVSITLTLGAYVNGFLSGLFAYLYLRYEAPAYNATGSYTAPIILFAFLIGVNAGLTLSSALEAGVSTIFVGLGEDPQILADRSPGLYAEIARAYPHVLNPV